MEVKQMVKTRRPPFLTASCIDLLQFERGSLRRLPRHWQASGGKHPK